MRTSFVNRATIIFTIISTLLAVPAFASLRSKLSIDRQEPDRTGHLGGYANVVKKAAPSVVSIQSTKHVKVRSTGPYLRFYQDPFFRRFFGDPYDRQVPQAPTERKPVQTGLGSGVIVSKDGYIITNNHVIDGADEIQVSLPNQKKEYEAKLVGRDAATDLAVLKIEGADDLPAATLGDSSKLAVGDTVLAIGTPFGLNQTVTSGIISALGRTDLHITGYENFIQTDASINPGNSGGALIDNRGRIIGINTAIVSGGNPGNVGIGFAIPINMAVDIADKLVAKGSIERGYLGIMLSNVTEDLAAAFGVDEKGALVNQVVEQSPAERGGVKSGDIVVRFEDKAVPDASKLRLWVASKDPEDVVKLTVIRDGEEKELEVTLGRLDGDGVAQSNWNDAKTSPGPLIEGVKVENLTDTVRQRLGIPNDLSGIVVTQVDPASSAAKSGLRQGEIITEVGRTKVETVAEALEAKEEITGDVVLLRVVDADGARFVAVPVTS